jgi:alkanesulfonate monooxygenase SsuD/methylene tetrahydromethanopterin reductase-like flavin-dependent oxidoreductase (luciferase family)
MRPEYEAANVPFRDRGGRLEELVTALRVTWTPGPVAFAGRYFRIPRGEIEPKPYQSGGPPILVGAATAAAIARAARIADGFNPMARSWPDLRTAVRWFRTAAERAGRNPTRLWIAVRAAVPLTRSRISGERPFLGGSARQVVEDLRRLERLGVHHVLFTNVRQPPLDEQLSLLDGLRAAADHAHLLEETSI